MLSELVKVIAENFLYLALHLSGSGSFPPPLSAAEEARCLKEIAQGSAQAKSCLIEHNLRLVAHIINLLWSSTDEFNSVITANGREFSIFR